MRKSRLGQSSLLVAAFALPTAPASAETLGEALAAAYQNNPALNAARANQRATDEEVNLRLAQGRPAANVQGNYTRNLELASPLSTTRNQWVAQGAVQAPLYSGGTIRNSIQAAKLRVQAGQNELRGNEASLFSQVVAAYMDVIRDSAVVSLNIQNVQALDVNLRASRDRFEVGDVTRTDVAQSESRLALAHASLEQAQAQLIGSKENYIALVGAPPVDLQNPPPLPGLPAAPEDAVSVALTDNPDILAAIKSRDAARFDVKSAEGSVMPTVSAFANGSYVRNTGVVGEDYLGYPRTTNIGIGANVTLPLYQGGQPAARQRQAVALESAAIEQSIQTERATIAQVRTSYANWQASLQTIESTERASTAAELSLEGVKAENSVGSRTILDILNAEQEALNARVQVVSARRNAYVAAFSLLAAMGHAEARDLNLGTGPLYDPAVNYGAVKGKLLDFDFRPRPKPQSTRTNTTPPQTAASATNVKP